MAKGLSYLWRKPGRRDEERKKFAALMRRLEAVRDAERANVAYAQGENHFVVAHPIPTGGTTRICV
jgi:hypothetical protein